ncbi:MAG: hypothetical protein IJ613_06860, partial [Muribaculaceae bacterium]|nr:hypothetical protein [Muribaculaceae bacterium]
LVILARLVGIFFVNCLTRSPLLRHSAWQKICSAIRTKLTQAIYRTHLNNSRAHGFEGCGGLIHPAAEQRESNPYSDVPWPPASLFY